MLNIHVEYMFIATDVMKLIKKAFLSNSEIVKSIKTGNSRRLIKETLDIPPCRVGSVGSVSASRTVGREFASRPGHTKDHHKNGTNCLPA